ncbi:ribonuclease H-like domain-containing protein [Cohnella nanjingensis]|uniref:ribonuclease H-like domain-containing protein n=1 Tax=Cohnella nanjingensis TaxID=1387779 RepID=UPI001FE52875|nr:ribonuclease H-like domain-containing protein [Cohnella nanjingensis]
MSGGLRDKLERLRAHAASVKQAEAAAREADTAARAEADGGVRAAGSADESRSIGADAAGSEVRNGMTPAGEEGTGRPASACGRGEDAFADLGAEEVRNDHGVFLLRTAVYPLEHRHGHYLLEQLPSYAAKLKPVAARQNKGRTDREEAEPDAIETERLLFLDTETTGLGVGAGNVPFMVGIGYADLKARQFVVEQLLIRHPGEERAMLAYLLTRFAGRTHLVTYNGRTFDWPVLVNRFVLNGWRRSGAEPGHLDFLHPSRALWRNTLPSCKLSRIEEDRLGISRAHDVPGALAPELYLRYLNEGDAEHLRGVFIHNERDVLTLVTLAIHFGGLLDGRLGAEWALPEEPEELYRTASWLDANGGPDHAERLFAALIARRETSAERWLLPTAGRYKRLGRLDEAAALWLRAAEAAERSVLPSFEAHVELAMLYEHRVKDAALALRYAERALELAHRKPLSARDPARGRAEREGLAHRIERLRRKTNAPLAR